MKYENVSVTDFCWFFCDKIKNVKDGFDFMFEDNSKITELEMFDFIKIKTKNFEQHTFKYFMIELKSFAVKMLYEIEERGSKPAMSFELFEQISKYPKQDLELNGVYFECLDYDKNASLRIILKENFYPGKVIKNLQKLFQFSDIAESEYKRVTESNSIETENMSEAKTKLNRRQKIALLESVGVMKFLESNVFAGNQTQTAKFLSLIIDYDQQNIRNDIIKVPEFLLNQTKITDVINPILNELGLKSKE